MRIFISASMIGIAIFFFSLTTSAKTSHEMAKASLHDTNGKAVGEAKFEEANKGVKVSIAVTALPPGMHAVHIHESGKCEAPDFKSAGGHFNPTGKEHGHHNPKGWHAGDLPNLNVKQDGTGKASWLDADVTLKSDAPNSLFRAGGTSLVIHASKDDEVSDPVGNAGARIVCGVIEHTGR